MLNRKQVGQNVERQNVEYTRSLLFVGQEWGRKKNNNKIKLAKKIRIEMYLNINWNFLIL